MDGSAAETTATTIVEKTAVPAPNTAAKADNGPKLGTESPEQAGSSWQEKLSPQEQELHKNWGETVGIVTKAIAGNSLVMDNEALARLQQALNAYETIQNDPDYDPIDGCLYIDPNNPDVGRTAPYQVQIEPVMNVLRQIVDDPNVPAELKESAGKHLDYLEVRYTQVVDDNGQPLTKDGETYYAFTAPALPNEVVILMGNKETNQPGCRGVFLRVFKYAAEQGLKESNPRLYHELASVIALFSSDQSIPNEIIFQMAVELFTNLDAASANGTLPRLAANIGSAYNTVRTLARIKHQEKSGSLQPEAGNNQFARWLVKRLRTSGVKIAGQEIIAGSEEENQLIEQLGPSALPILTYIEARATNTRDVLNTPIGRFFESAGLTGAINTLSQAETANPQLKNIIDEAVKSGALPGIAESIYGSKGGISDGLIDQLAILTGLDRQKILDKAKEKGIDIKKLGVNGGFAFLLIYSIIGPMMGEEEGGRPPEA